MTSRVTKAIQETAQPIMSGTEGELPDSMACNREEKKREVSEGDVEVDLVYRRGHILIQYAFIGINLLFSGNFFCWALGKTHQNMADVCLINMYLATYEMEKKANFSTAVQKKANQATHQGKSDERKSDHTYMREKDGQVCAIKSIGFIP